jgi:hypothetical protein
MQVKLKRIKAFVMETLVAVILVTAFVAYLFTLPKGTTLNWQRIALVLNTLVVFGFLLSWFRDALKLLSFWAAFSILLLSHMTAYLFFLGHTEGWPLAYYVMLNPIELAIFTPILRKIVRGRPE